MFRSIGAFLVVGAIVHSFAACGPKSNDDSTTPPLATAGGAGIGGVGAGGPNPGGANPGGSSMGGLIFGTGGVAGASGSAGATEDAGCGQQDYQGEQVPLDIYIMFDRSASMTCTTATGTRWDAVKAALSSFVQNA